MKELEHHLQALEAKKFTLTQQQKQDAIIHDPNGDIATNNMNKSEMPQLPLYFRKLFSSPQYTWSQISYKNNFSKSNSTIANIEVNLVNEHANLRILMRKQLTQLSKIVGFLETSCLTILHLNVTTLDPFVLYSIILKVCTILGCKEWVHNRSFTIYWSSIFWCWLYYFPCFALQLGMQLRMNSLTNNFNSV